MLSQAKKRRKIGVAQPEATARSHIAEEAAQSETRESFVAIEAAQTAITPDSAHLAATPVNDAPLPDRQQV